MVWQFPNEDVERGNIDWDGWYHEPRCTGPDWTSTKKVVLRRWDEPNGSGEYKMLIDGKTNPGGWDRTEITETVEVPL